MSGCEHCQIGKPFLTWDDIISHSAWGWGWDGLKINYKEAIENASEIGVFIDRGYLRLCDLDDCDCMDHGERIKIKYCPFCGIELKEN